jgi:K(+)-stimulated pyrophosphate-energized sodium pump
VQESMILAWIGVGAGIVALLFALATMASVLKESMGTPKMKEISEAIQEGAMAFLNRQYKTLIPFALIIFVLLLFYQFSFAVSFLVGAVCSAIAGYIGMNSTTKANARTTEAARSSGLSKALTISFRAGAVMGLSVAGLGLLGVSSLFLIFKSATVINSFAFGASAIAFFARVGGGIYTKLLMWVRTWLVRLRQVFPRMIRETLQQLPITLETMLATLPAWVPTSLNPMLLPPLQV